ncbi:MAG: amidohydrolase, partial [Clostridiales bacterium]|nr:amidohydrolase [Clostridiales bacterium]
TPEGGGVVELEDDDKPNGVLREQCTQVIDNVIKDPLKDEKMKEKVMLDVFKDMAEKGITTIHTYSAKIWNYEESIETYEGFEKRGILPVRVTVCLDELFDAPDKINDNPDKLVQLGAYKLFTDGSLGANSAKLREPYEGLDTDGLMICTEDELYERMKIAYDRGLQPAIHAIGDKALEITLNAIEKTLKNSDRKPNLPFRIIHVQMTPPDLLERMSKLPVVLDIQPIFLRTDLHWIEDKLGKERAKHSYMWKTMSDIGLIEAGSSDCPVESYDPIKGIYLTVTRCDYEGFPAGGYNPSEKVPVFDAVAMYTKNAHYATGQENMMGLIKENYFADFAILDRDIFEIDELDILNVKVKGTYLAGKKVY